MQLTHRFLRIFILIDGKAGHQLTVVLFELRLQLRTGSEATAAAGVEGAARRRIQRTWQLAGQLNPLTAIVRIQPRRGGEQRLGIRMTWIVKICSLVPFSTQRPKYMTITSSAMCSTTDRSCEIKT
ncbi:Uncharacterised protein [Salmonella enterica subsp. arizonae]|uniref:Uncharacterized protein n=1 Tax=Salmonella enterica subsp. arizonae TaxID=59203 RepID=A0A447QWQ4_SALER|nr:Uncharacterised protein [Salmonella enterica subsp. arizonae]